MSTDSFFEEYTGVPRDRWKRPLIVPPGGGERVPYTRASTMANYIADHTNLHTWEKRSLTKGMGIREDLCALAAALPPIAGNQRNKQFMTPEEKRRDAITNTALDEIAEEAMRAANRDYKADWGTAIHGFTDPGADLSAVPERMRADVVSFLEAMRAFVIIATELFIVNDDLQAAGTFDHLVYLRHAPSLGAFVLDKKTGVMREDAHAIQLAIYAGGVLYDQHDDTRRPLESLLPDGVPHIRRDTAVVASIPLGEGATNLYQANIEIGRDACEHAAWVRSFRKVKKDLCIRFDPLMDARLHVGTLIQDATTRVELEGIYADWHDVWHDDLTALTTARLRAIGEPTLAEVMS